MPNAALEPTMRGLFLGRALRRVRNETGTSLEAAAGSLGWHPSKLSRIENGRQHMPPEDISPLLKVYGVDEPEVVDGFERLARDAAKRVGWWQGFSGVLTPRYADLIALEAEAESVRVYAPLVVPGLLQTAAYARAITNAMVLTRKPEEVAALVDVRQARQAVLSRPNRPLRYGVIIEESVLRRSFRSHPGVMREQLQRLLDAAAKPNITIQVLPLDADPHPGCAGGFDLVAFSPPMPSQIVELETLRGSSYVDDPEHAKLWDVAWRDIAEAALTVNESAVLIRQLREGST